MGHPTSSPLPILVQDSKSDHISPFSHICVPSITFSSGLYMHCGSSGFSELLWRAERRWEGRARSLSPALPPFSLPSLIQPRSSTFIVLYIEWHCKIFLQKRFQSSKMFNSQWLTEVYFKPSKHGIIGSFFCPPPTCLALFSTNIPYILPLSHTELALP